MSAYPPPTHKETIFNSANFPADTTSSYLAFPTAQGTETFPNGLVLDTIQNRAYGSSNWIKVPLPTTLPINASSVVILQFQIPYAGTWFYWSCFQYDTTNAPQSTNNTIQAYTYRLFNGQPAIECEWGGCNFNTGIGLITFSGYFSTIPNQTTYIELVCISQGNSTSPFYLNRGGFGNAFIAPVSTDIYPFIVL
jgi:hypothetical protein